MVAVPSQSVADLSAIVSRVTAAKGVSTLPAGFAIKPPPYQQIYGTLPKSMPNAYNQSWDKIAGPLGIKKIGYVNPRGIRVSGTRVGVDLTIRPNEEFQKMMKRLPHAPRYFKRELVKALRTAVRQEFLKPLRKNIPRRKGKQVERIARDIKIDRRKRGRTQVYGKKKHIRQTARIAKVEIGKVGKPNRIVVTVGSADLWYGAILHSRVPFFPMTVEQQFGALNRRIEKEMLFFMDYLARGRKRLV